MSFERTIALSFFLHVLVLAALSIQIKTRFVMPSAFEVNLVSPGISRAAPAGKETAPAAQKIAPVKAVKTPPRKMAVPKPEKKPVMAPVKITRPAGESEEEETEAAIEKIVIRQGVSGIEKIVKLQESISIGREAPGAGTQEGTGTSPLLAAYAGRLKQEIWKKWIYPDVNINGLATTMTIIVSRNGMLTIKNIDSSSGDKLFDRSAVRAVESASPAAPPPVDELEVVIKFHL